MSERPLDAERVAALLDGRLSASERELVLAQIAGDPDWREVLADAAAVAAVPAGIDVLRGSVRESPHATPQSSSHDTLHDARRAATAESTNRRPFRWTPILMAASVLFAVALGTWRLTSPATSPVLASEDVLTVALGEGFDAARDRVALDSRWPRVRALSETLTPRAIGVRVGAMSVDLLALAQPQDSATLSTVREELVATLQLVPGSGPIVSGVQNATKETDLQQALRSTRLLVDSVAFDAGAWIEVARLTDVNDSRRRSAVARLKETAKRFSDRPDAVRLIDAIENMRTPRDQGSDPRALFDSLLIVVAR